MALNGYMAYKQKSRISLSASQNISALLGKAANHVANMATAIQSQDIETRVTESNKAFLILGGLKEAALRAKSQEAASSEMLEQYYGTFQALLLKASMNSNLKETLTIEKNLRSMVDFWRNMDTLTEAHSAPSNKAMMPAQSSLSMGA